MKSVIAIDGPAGAGKSTIAKKIAKKLDYKYLDTGAMYRAVTWYVLKTNTDISNKDKITNITQNININFEKDINSKTHIYVNNKDITEEIRTTEIDNNVSNIAQIEGVRKELVKMQKNIAKDGKIVMDGRDIASRVLPNADLKIYLTASLEERAKRRFDDIKDKNSTSSFKKVKKEIKRRDEIDKNREHSPLTKTDDAILIDSSNLSIEEVIDKIMSLIKEGE